MKTFLQVTFLFLISSSIAFGSEPVKSSIIVYEFNSVANKYYAKPTRVTTNKKQSVMWIAADSYKLSEYGAAQELSISMKRKHTRRELGKHIALLDKFYNWADIAVQKGDVLTKKVGSAKVGAFASITYTFHMASESNPYLSLTYCLTACLDHLSLNLPIEQVSEYKRLISDFSNGALSVPDPSDYQ